MIEMWAEDARNSARKHFEDELKTRLHNIDRQRTRMHVAASMLIDAIPEIEGIEENEDKFEVKKIVRGGLPGDLSSFKSVLTIGQGEEREIYSVHFSREDYPDLKVKKGYSVKKCTDTSRYKNFMDLGNWTIWEEMNESDEDFRKVVGLTLYGMLDDLTEDKNFKDIKRILSFIQKS